MQKILRSAFKTDVLRKKSITQVRTRQGAMIGPLLSNIVLHGIENISNQSSKCLSKKSNKMIINKSYRVKSAHNMMIFIE